jgi:hypothetical protein
MAYSFRKIVLMDLRTLFHSIEPDHFNDYFGTDQQCLEYLAKEKNKEGFLCRHCGSTNYGKGLTLYSRRCTHCKREESATAGTIFHRCRIPLTTAFGIAYLVCGRPGINGKEISRILETRHMTCLKFKKRILKCIDGGAEFLKFADNMTGKHSTSPGVVKIIDFVSNSQYK